MRFHEIYGQVALLERHADIVDRLMQWKDDPTILLSFTDIAKIGINPTSGFDTPLAIYAYPLREIWLHLVNDTIPFAGDRTYAQVLRATASILELSQYGDADLRRDLERLRLEWSPRLQGARRSFQPAYLRKQRCDALAQQKFGADMDALTPEQAEEVKRAEAAEHEATDNFDLLVETQTRLARVQSPAGIMWNITGGLAEAAADKTFRKPSIIWNGILRGLGYRIISDRTGLGIIHQNEPIQVAVLAGDAIRHVAMAHNVRKTIRHADNFEKLEVKCPLDLAGGMAASRAIKQEWPELLMTGESHHFKLSVPFDNAGINKFVSQRLRDDYRDLPKVVEVLTRSPFLTNESSGSLFPLGMKPPSELRNKRWAWQLFCKTIMTPERLEADSATYASGWGRPPEEYVFDRVKDIFRFLNRVSARTASQDSFEAAWKQFTSFVGADVMAAITDLTGRAPLVDVIRADFARLTAEKSGK